MGRMEIKRQLCGVCSFLVGLETELRSLGLEARVFTHEAILQAGSRIPKEVTPSRLYLQITPKAHI